MRIAILSFFVILMSCSSSKNTATSSEINNLKEIVNNRNIEVNFNWARPTGSINNVRGIEKLFPAGSNINNVDLIGNPNFFKIKNDSVYMDLPYYGERQFSGGYNSDTGLKFKGKPKQFKKVFDAKKNAYIFNFFIDNGTENYDTTLTLFTNKKSSLYVNSNSRTSISYDGNWKEYVIEKE